MKVTVEGSVKEIAALAVELKGRQISISMAPITTSTDDFQKRIQKRLLKLSTYKVDSELRQNK